MSKPAPDRDPRGTAAGVGVLALLLPATLACGGPTDDLRLPRRLADLPSAVERIAEQRLDADGIPGAAVALVGPDGFSWTRGFGYTDVDRSQRVDADTLFALQSVTKTFTAMAVLSAVEDGLLDLDAPITRWLPDFRVRTRFAPHPERRITLRRLLAHRAGLTHEAPVGNNFSSDEPTFDAHLASIPDTWLRFPVGERTAYSNLGFDLAGAVVQAVDGRPFADALRTRVLARLGMARARIASAALAEVPNRARGRIGEVPAPLVIPLEAAGGLYASANDLVPMLRAMLSGGAPVLSRASFDEMHRIQFPEWKLQASGSGLGVWVLRGAEDRVILANHEGGGYGFRSYLAWYPEIGLALAVLQHVTEASALVEEIVRAVETVGVERAGQGWFARDPELAERPACESVSAAAAEPLVGAWVGRWRNVALAHEGSELGVLGRRFVPLCRSVDGLLLDREASRADAWRVIGGGRGARLVGANSGNTYAYNDGPLDPTGPGHSRWREYLGSWRLAWWSVAPIELSLHAQRGWLYLEGLRLEEYEPGLFFSSDGEALDLRTDPATWRSIPIERVADAFTDTDAARVGARALERHALLRAGASDAFLESATEVFRAAIGGQLAAIWEGFVEGAGDCADARVARVDALADGRAHVHLALACGNGPRRLIIGFGATGETDLLLLHDDTPASWWLDHPPADETALAE